MYWMNLIHSFGISADFTPGLCPPCAELKSFPCNKKPPYEEKPCKEPVQTVEGVGRGSCEPEVVACPPHCRKINKLEQEIKRYKERWEHLPPYNGFGSEEDSIGQPFFVPLCVSVCICDVNAFVWIFQELFLQSEISLPQQRECSYCCCFPSWILSIIEWNETLQWIAWVCIRSTWRWRTSSVSWSTTEELSTATSWGSMPEFKPTFLLTRKGSSYLSTTGPMIPSRFMKPRSITQVHMRWWQWLWLWWLW